MRQREESTGPSQADSIHRLQEEIAELKRRNEELRSGEAQVRLLASLPAENPNPVLRVSAEGILLYQNPAAEALPSWRGEIGQPFPNGDLRRLVETALAEDKPIANELELGGMPCRVAIAPVAAQGHANVYGLDSSARHATEQALRQSREDLDRAQAVGQIGWWRLDTRANVLTWSPENHRIFGVPEGTPLTYEAFLAIVHPDDRQYVDAQWQEGLRGQPYDLEHRILAQGKLKWVREKAYLERDSEGRLLGGFGITQDITARKLAEEALRASERRLIGVLESMPDAFVSFDADLRYTYVNATAERLQDARREDLLGKDVREVYPDPESGKTIREYERAIRDQKPVTSTSYHAGFDRWVEVRAFPTPDGVSVFFKDVSAQVSAEQALRASEASLKRAQEIAHLGSWELDLVSSRLTWSDEVYRIFGLQPQEFVATYEAFLDHLHPDDRNAVDDAYLNSVREDRDSYETEHRVVRHDTGEIRVVREKCQHLRDRQARIVRSLGMVHDITESRRAEDALRRAAEELRRSNQDLQQFAYVASHDLREPLRMVGGFLTLIEERYGPQLDDTAREFIGHAVAGATRMSQLIDDLLEYSRVSTRGRPLKPTQAGEALAAALAHLGPAVEEAGAAVTLGELPAVRGDPTQLTQLFQNLIANAVKFRSPERPCRVHVAVRRRNDHWEFSIQDNGIGIPEDAHERIFTIFQRLHPRDRYPGTGIGLAICKKIVERHGGRIWLESRPGEGTTFYFTLPVVRP